MQTRNKMLDDLARVAGGALGAASGVRAEVEARLREQFERILSQMDLVTREEFDAVRDMAVKAREEQEDLAGRVAALEKELAALKKKPASGGGARTAKSSSAKSSSSKASSSKTSPAKASGRKSAAGGGGKGRARKSGGAGKTPSS